MHMPSIDIGNRLKHLRKITGLSRQSLAQISNISAATIRSWEDGIVDIRIYNLEKYLNTLEEIGCSATIKWVMDGKRADPCATRVTDKLYKTLGAVDVQDILEILAKSSNLFYYLDAKEGVVYVNPQLLLLLESPLNSRNILLENATFKEICSEEVYDICHKYFTLCKSRKIQTFSYHINHKTSRRVEMIYYPIIKSKSTTLLGIMGFVKIRK